MNQTLDSSRSRVLVEHEGGELEELLSRPVAGMNYGEIAKDPKTILGWGKAFAESGMFGCHNEAQGQVLSLTMHLEGKSPKFYNERYHIIDGKFSPKPSYLLTELQRLGGDFELLCYTSDKAEIAARFGKNTVRVTLTWEEAQKEDWPWFWDKSGQKTLKPAWRTNRGRQIMLWHRVVSQAVPVVCPGAGLGADEIADDEPIDWSGNGMVAEAAKPKRERVQREKKVEAPTTPETPDPTTPDSAPVTEAAETPAPQAPAPAVTKDKPKKPGSPQLGQLDALYQEIQAANPKWAEEQWTKLLQGSNATRIEDVPAEKVDKFIDYLRPVVDKLRAKAKAESANPMNKWAMEAATGKN